MATLNPVELLKRLIKEPTEGSWLEFKQNNCSSQMIGEWVSAAANAAILAGKDRAYLVFGVDDKTRDFIGTNVHLASQKVGNENLTNWLSRMIEPRVMMEFIDDVYKGQNFSIIVIEPTYDRPVRFSGTEYLRIGENVKKLCDFPDHERSIWFATSRRKFEDSVAATHQRAEDIFEKLDVEAYYKLSGNPRSADQAEVIAHLISLGFLKDTMEDTYDITNLGAILFASDITHFPSISSKSVRVIKYLGSDKSNAESEQEGRKGYAVGFSGMLVFILNRLPKAEVYIEGIRKHVPIYPEIAIREILANALIHQDFTVSGAGPVVEIYSNRVEITNPGNSLLQIDRIIDERRSRNEKLASTMRTLGLCEERGGGLDKAITDIEERSLPAPKFQPSENSMRVVVHGPKNFRDMSKEEKRSACFYHSVIRWIRQDYMSNATLRARFSLSDDDYQAVSGVIADALRSKRIAPAEWGQGKRVARYVPYWAAPPPLPRGINA